ncbi:MAG: MBL fold metallo-hydrolase [Chloroflexota bacterium]
MSQGIRTIGVGNVNCFLVRTDDGFVQVDTSLPGKRADLEKELAAAGCRPGDLNLIVLTHGDYDHAGNAAYLREKYGARVAMHSADSGRVERGDWNWGMKAKPDRFRTVFRVVSLFIRPGKFDTFVPDIYVEDGQSLAEYGFDARVLHLPGHTRGSIGVLTAGGDLFCGDLLDNMFGRPELHFYIDDLAAANASVEKLKRLGIGTAYPGHGKPFPMGRFLKNRP